METINLKDKFSHFSDYWNPRIIGELNDCHIKAVKLKGEFVWLITTTKTSSSLSPRALYG